MPYDQAVIDGVKEILQLLSPDKRINNLLNERIKGQPQRNHLLLNALADILDEQFLTINRMEQSIMGSLSELGLGLDTIHFGGEDEENDFVINNQTVSSHSQQLQPIRDIVQGLREDAVRCEQYDKTRTS